MFQPAVGTGGYLGWRILENSEVRQREQFENSPLLEREIEYFRENISKATSAEALVEDRRLLRVALGAFGLGDELNKGAFIQKILEEGTLETRAFANRLNDPRFRELAEAFSYGNLIDPDVESEAFREDIIARYKTLEFERAVGDVDGDMRVALNFRREIGDIAAVAAESETTAWFRIMGNPPLRELVATALNVPADASQVDIDQQRELFADRAQRVFGSSSPEIFSDPDMVNDIIRRFFLNRQLESGPGALTPGFGALTLLQNTGLGAGASLNLFLSQT